MKRTLIRLMCILPAMVAGCGYNFYATKPLTQVESIGVIDPENNPYFKIRNVPRENQREPEKSVLMWTGYNIQAENPSRFAYHRDWFTLGVIYVPVEMPNGKTYKGWFDTGNPSHLFINDGVIRDNNLDVYPISDEPCGPFAAGITCIPRMTVGTVRVDHMPAVYNQQQWEMRFMGVCLAQQREFLIGLGFMRSFSYVMLDNPRREIELGRTIFEPAETESWKKYPLEIMDVDGAERLMVKLPVNGIDMCLMFDTCGGNFSIDIEKEQTWRQLKQTTPTRQMGTKRVATAQFGWTSCREMALQELTIACITRRNARIAIMSESDKFIQTGADILTLEHFRNNIIVLDFDQNLFWVKN